MGLGEKHEFFVLQKGFKNKKPESLLHFFLS